MAQHELQVGDRVKVLPKYISWLQGAPLETVYTVVAADETSDSITLHIPQEITCVGWPNNSRYGFAGNFWHIDGSYVKRATVIHIGGE